MSTSKIDSLLQQYLSLLHEYTILRAHLSTLQSSLHQHLARANFSAQPGIRYYGQDYYDERMQATSRLETIISPLSNTPEFKLVKLPPAAAAAKPEQPENEPAQGKNNSSEEKQQQQQQDQDEKSTARSGGENDDHADVDQQLSKDDAGEVEGKGEGEGETETEMGNDDEKPKLNEKKKKSNDPLRWFGILTPLPLRQAQADAKKAVEDVIPRLASLSEQMKGLELEVRRERKKRAKAEKEEAKLKVKELEEKLGGVELGEGKGVEV
ncbi:hypothetical protein B0T21DRAFT_27578 [Apiosordaria backusii]|uniref:Vacuolar ATPase assembly protein VMA22 n=1 Tax=Apiosordaria backusii TaxID=314023 RepID=A0AA40F0A1_9PEZI|nr:hypothetical protein B0T21DRAFT_27578 [Apiosordaria backusii]